MSQSSIIIRPLGPIVNAYNRIREALYTSPQTYISSLNDNQWPAVLNPIQPMSPPGAEPLGWPITWGQNLNFVPRYDAEYGADELRRLATYPLARICIENNKDMLTRMPWKVQLKAVPGETAKDRASRGKNDANIKKLNDFFARPNRNEDWPDFWRPIIEDMLVIDAASVFVGKDKKGNVAELRWIEGASITRLVDEHGWTPPPPNPAYQQLWQGYPRLDFTTDQLVYRPRNIVPRFTASSYLYGFSPCEQIAQEIKIGQARLNYIYDFYAEGTIPGGILFAPLGTPPDKIKEAQQFLDSDLAGQLAKRRRLQILQGFQQDGKTEQLHFPKEPTLADLFDEQHIRKVCFAFGTSPNRLMRMINRASGQSVQDAAEEEGTLPFLHWFKSTGDFIIQIIFKLPNYEIAFDPFHELDKLKSAMADTKEIESSLYSINEKREDRGDDPRPEKWADMLLCRTSQGLVPLGTILPTGGASGTSGSPRPTTTTQTRIGSSAGEGGAAAKSTNGHTTKWHGCDVHSSSYPRSFCSKCQQSEILWQNEEARSSLITTAEL